MRSSFFALLLIGCASAPPPPPEPAAPTEPTFAIQLHRPARIGDVRKQRTTMTSTQSLVVTSDDAMLQQQADEVHVVFAGTEKILDINEHGIATKSEYAVEEAYTESQAGHQELLVTGAVLVVTRGVESPFALEEGKLSPEAEKILAMMFSTSKPTHTDDEIFGTEPPQPVGATWPIRADVAARDLTNAGLAVEAAALTGETTLTGVETVGNLECLEISANLKADNVTPPGLQSGDTIEKSHLETSFVGSFPTNVHERRLNDASEMTAEIIILRTVEGRPVRTELVMKRILKTTYSDATPAS